MQTVVSADVLLWRRQFRARVLRLFLIVAAISAIVALIHEVYYLREMWIARTIRSHGGWVDVGDTTPWWIQEAYGVQLPGFGRVLAVDLSGRDIPPGVLNRLESLSSVQHLDLSGTPVTDELLERLKRLHQLESLNLSHTQITDRGFKALKDCHKLRSLSLDGTQLSDTGLSYVGRMRTISPGVVEVRTGLGSLQRLSIAQTEVTDAGLKHLAVLDLRQIDLRKTHVTPKGLTALAQELHNCEIIW